MHWCGRRSRVGVAWPAASACAARPRGRLGGGDARPRVRDGVATPVACAWVSGASRITFTSVVAVPAAWSLRQRGAQHDVRRPVRPGARREMVLRTVTTSWLRPGVEHDRLADDRAVLAGRRVLARRGLAEADLGRARGRRGGQRRGQRRRRASGRLGDRHRLLVGAASRRRSVWPGAEAERAWRAAGRSRRRAVAPLSVVRSALSAYWSITVARSANEVVTTKLARVLDPVAGRCPGRSGSAVRPAVSRFSGGRFGTECTPSSVHAPERRAAGAVAPCRR